MAFNPLLRSSSLRTNRILNLDQSSVTNEVTQLSYSHRAISISPIRHNVSTSKNYLILDIDGVFNPFMGTNLPSKGYKVYRRIWINWALNIPLHSPMLRNLEEYADIVWGSNWLEDSNALAEWFSMKKPSYPHIPLLYGTTDSSNETWKLESIIQWCEEHTNPGDRIVWIDDELQDDAYEWASRRGNFLMIKTDPRFGLTESQTLSAVSFFANS